MGFLHSYLQLFLICVICDLDVYGTSQCEDLKRCLECVINPKCAWCPQPPQCRFKNDPFAGLKIENETHCPQLSDNTLVRKYISTDEAYPFSFNAINLDKVANETMFGCLLRDSKNALTSVAAQRLENQINCSLMAKLDNGTSKAVFRIVITYDNLYELDDEFYTSVTVYSCRYIGSDCQRCLHLNTSRYSCSWCGGTCIPDINNSSCSSVASDCPSAEATQIQPTEGRRNATVTITLANQLVTTFPIVVWFLEVGGHGSECHPKNITNDPDFDNNIITRIICENHLMPQNNAGIKLSVYVLINSNPIKGSSIAYTYQVPVVTNITPTFGPKAGGTKLTCLGNNLTYAYDMKIMFNSVIVEDVNIINNATLQSLTPSVPNLLNANIKVFSEDAIISTRELWFKYLPDPRITNVSSNRSFLKGGKRILLTGINLNNSNEIMLVRKYENNTAEFKLTNVSDTTIDFNVPEASQDVSFTVKGASVKRKKRSEIDECVDVSMEIRLDGVRHGFTFYYCRDPSFNAFNSTVSIPFDLDYNLTITGEYLNLAAEKDDYIVAIGDRRCLVLILNKKNIVCRVPMLTANSTTNAKETVTITVGNIQCNVGTVQYVKLEVTNGLPVTTAAALGGSLLFVIIIGLIIGVIKFRAIHIKAKKYTDKITCMETEVLQVARMEFLDTNTSMQNVNRNLVQQGFPYHEYQTFAYNVITARDSLAFDPLVTSIQSKGASVMASEKDIYMFEQLLLNKFFLVSLIITLEKQKQFFIREKSLFTGYLCSMLMGRMEYLQEIIAVLVTDMMKQSSRKKSLKSSFRRCETITEQLVSNWMSLCLYPYLKSKAGNALYILYMGTLRIMENGPIDAITGDAKYTLCENQLMTKWNLSEEDHTNDLKFEAKHLTLNVAIDSCDECYKCQVLDCDTISQVKKKCLSQIYVNYPASQLQVEPDDVWLEWHEGFGGVLLLRDEDSTSLRDGDLLRLNTLKHYNVKDGSNMTLRDINGEDEEQEYYENMTNIKLDFKHDNNINRNSERLADNTTDETLELKRWHLVKPEDEGVGQLHTVISELYLNRLLTTKQGINEYLHDLFDAILTIDNFPQPVKFLFDVLDQIGEELKVDQDTVHSWKSHSYQIRVWATLIKNPSLLFDVNIPSYVDANLELISQCFIECHSLASQQLTKETPSQKLIFHKEVMQYKDKVTGYFKHIKHLKSLEDFQTSLKSINLLQKDIQFNKRTALNMLYMQLKPYLEEIVEDLSTNDVTKNLQLHSKFQQLFDTQRMQFECTACDTIN